MTVFDEPAGLLRELACGSAGGGLCLGVVGSSVVQLMSCASPLAKGWVKETVGHRADPLEKFS